MVVQLVVYLVLSEWAGTYSCQDDHMHNGVGATTFLVMGIRDFVRNRVPLVMYSLTYESIFEPFSLSSKKQDYQSLSQGSHFSDEVLFSVTSASSP